jgi:Domain of unknown function (DUF5615)
VAQTNLRLLLDESITEPLAGWITGLVPSAARSTKLVGFGATDQAVAACANQLNRVLVAMDSDFNKIVVQEGVIKLNSPDSTDDHCLYQIFHAFWKSGLRAKSKRKRTFLTKEGVRIQNGEPIEHRWKPKPCTGPVEASG